MAKLKLTMLDTSGIQEYIFNSNRLQENISRPALDDLRGFLKFSRQRR